MNKLLLTMSSMVLFATFSFADSHNANVDQAGQNAQQMMNDKAKAASDAAQQAKPEAAPEAAPEAKPEPSPEVQPAPEQKPENLTPSDETSDSNK